MNKLFDELKIIFNKNNFRLYIIGGSSRDYFLNREITDYDFVTDATPSDIKNFLDVDMTFARYGTVKYYYDKKTKVDITTLREEKSYIDNRHPSEVNFIKDISIDYKRRDFTINSIYITENYEFLDPTGFGISDLENGILRFIGDPITRIKEDPLRILRGERFAIEYNLSVSDEYKKLFDENRYLLSKISKEKLEEEKKKLEKVKNGLNYELPKL